MRKITNKERVIVSVEKSFSLRFLKSNPSIDDSQEKWIWKPYKPFIFNLQTATFSGKNKADDYTNEWDKLNF